MGWIKATHTGFQFQKVGKYANMSGGTWILLGVSQPTCPAGGTGLLPSLDGVEFSS